MAIDINEYFNNRISQDMAREAQSGISTKFEELQAASEEKILAFREMGVAAQKREAIKRNSLVGRLNLDPEGLLASPVNVLDAVIQGVKTTSRSGVAAVDTAINNTDSVVKLAVDQMKDATSGPLAKQDLLANIERLKTANPDRNFVQAARDVGGSMIDNPQGSAEFIAEQLPNSVVSLGAGVAGAKAGGVIGGALGSVVPVVGTAAGAAVGGAVGFLGGMFLGTTLLETGGKAMEKAQDGSFTPQERTEAIREGAIKGGVITAVDAATFKLGGLAMRGLNKAAITAGARAEARVLASKGVDIKDLAAVQAALADPGTRSAAKLAGQLAARQTSSATARGATAAGALAMETVGEGAGEYLGELAATGEADVYDALLEAAAGFTQSVPEVGYNLIESKNNELDAKSIAAADLSIPDPQSPAKRVAQKVAIQEAVKTGNLEPLTDKTKLTYSPVDAINLLQRDVMAEGATDEVRTAASKKVGALIEELRVSREQAQSALLGLNPKSLTQGIERAQAELASLDSAAPEFDAKKLELEESIEYFNTKLAELSDPTKADDNAKLLKSRTEQLKTIDDQLGRASEARAQFDAELLKNVDVATEVKTITEMASTDPVKAAASAERLINVALRVPDKLTAETARTLSNMDSLPEAQRKFFREFDASRQASNTARNTKGVTEVIFNGAKGEYIGLNEYRSRMSDAINKGSIGFANGTLELLGRFAFSHRGKVQAAQDALEQVETAIAAGKKAPKLHVFKTEANGVWEIGQGFLSNEKRKKMGALNIGPGSKNLVNDAIPAEVAAIEATERELTAARDLKFPEAAAAEAAAEAEFQAEIALNTPSPTNVSQAPQAKQGQAQGSQVDGAAGAATAPAATGTPAAAPDVTAGAATPAVEANGLTQEASVNSNPEFNEILVDYAGDDAKDYVLQRNSKAIETLASLFGATLVTFSYRGNKAALAKKRGFGGRTRSGRLVIGLNVDQVKDSSLFVLGHEVFHVLEKTFPNESKALVKQLMTYVKKERRDWYDEQYKTLGASGITEREIAADLLGQMFTDRGFWAAVQRRNPGLVQRVLSIVESLIAKFKSGGDSRQAIKKYITDYIEVRDMLAEFVAQVQAPVTEGDSVTSVTPTKESRTPESTKSPEVNQATSGSSQATQATGAQPQGAQGSTPENSSNPDEAADAAAEDAVNAALDEAYDDAQAEEEAESREAAEVKPGILAAVSARTEKGKKVALNERPLGDFMTQNAGQVNTSLRRPLVVVKDFMEALRAGTVSVRDFLKADQDQALSEGEQNAIGLMQSLMPKWAETVFGNLIEKRSEYFRYENPIRYLISQLERDGQTNLVLEDNVLAAMVAGSLSFINDAASNGAFNDSKAINQLLGRPNDENPSNEAFMTLGTAGSYRTIVIDALGRRAVDALGFTLRKDAPADLKAKMIVSLGAHMLRLLEDQGILEVTEVRSEDISALREMAEITALQQGRYDDISPENEGVSLEKEDRTHKFYRLTFNEEGVLVGEAARIAAGMKGSKNVIQRLFGIESGVRFPSLAPVETVQSRSDTGMGVPGLHTQVMAQKQTQDAWEVNEDPYSVVRAFGQENGFQVAELFGWRPVIDKTTDAVAQNTHASEVIAKRAKNAGLERELNQFMEFVKSYLNDKLDTPFFLTYEMAKQQRVGIYDTAVNPQASKIHRWLAAPKAWETEIDPKNQEQMNSFWLRVAEGLGIKTEKGFEEASLDAVWDKLEDPVMEKGIDALVEGMENVSNVDFRYSDEQRAAITAAVALGGENGHSLAALVAVAKFEQVPFGTPFKTRLMAEVDGVSNGPILNTIFYGAAESLEAFNARLEKGGIYTLGSKYRHFNHWRADPAHTDIYETSARRVYKTIQGMLGGKKVFGNDLLTALWDTSGHLIDEQLDKVVKDGRDLLKNALNPINYGAGMKSMKRGMSDAYIKGIYKAFNKFAAKPDQAALDHFVSQLNVVLASERGPKIKVGQPIGYYMAEKLNPAQIKALAKAHSMSIGKATELVVEEDFGTFMDRKSIMTDATNRVYELYGAVYDAVRAQYMVELKIPTKTIKEKTQEGTVTKEVFIRDLSKEEEDVVKDRVKTIAPLMHTASSKAEGKLSNGIWLGKREQQQNATYPYKVRVDFAKQADKQDSMEIRGRSVQNIKPGPMAISGATHSADSAISHRTQLGRHILNIHDAVGAGINGIADAARAMNENTWNVVFDYSPLQESYDSLTRMIQGINQMQKKGQLSPEAIAALVKVSNGNPEKEIPSLETLMTALHRSAMNANRMKWESMAQWAVVDQYAFERGAYEVTDAQRKDAADRAANVASEMPKRDVALVAALNKTLGIPSEASAGPAEVPSRGSASDDGTDAGTGSNFSNMDEMGEAEKIDSYNTMQVLVGLDDGSVSGSFKDHLANLLAGIVNTVHGPYGALASAFKDVAVDSPFTAWLKALDTGRAPFASEIAASGLASSSQENFVAQQIEATVRTTLEANDATTRMAYYELNRLYKEAKVELKGKLPDEQYELLFKEEIRKGETVSHHLARFAAAGLASEQINKLLKFPTKYESRNLKGSSLGEKLVDLFERILARFTARVSGVFTGQQADNKLLVLVEQLVDIEARKKHSMKRAATSKLIDGMETQFGNLAEAARNTVNKAADVGFIKNSRFEVVKMAGNLTKVAVNQQVEQYLGHVKEAIDLHQNDYAKFASQLIKDVLGPDAMAQALLRATKHLETLRKQIITQHSTLTLAAFKAGVRLTRDDKKSVAKTVLRTGLHYLTGPGKRSIAEIEQLISDPALLDAAITATAAKLTSPMASMYHFQANALGMYKATGKVKTPVLMLNAHLIARMSGTQFEEQVSAKDVTASEAVIQELATLYALKYTPQRHKNATKEILRTEMNRDDGGNGIDFIMKVQAQMEKESLVKLFRGNPALMVHGYTPEIYNPHTAIKVANKTQGDKLELQGYEMHSRVALDPADPSSTQPDQRVRHIYVLKDGGLAPYLSGVMSMRDVGTLGSTKHDGYMNLDSVEGVINAGMQNDITTQKFKQLQPSKDPGKDLSGADDHLAPVFNERGDITNWRYLMAESTKDALLERDDTFDTVMGVFAGSIFDKVSSDKQNKEALLALRQQYAAAKEDSADFVRVAHDSDDPRMKEIWKMLPEDTRRNIRMLWGRDGMYVHKDMVDIVFGYRKFSAAQWFTDPENRKGLSKLTAVVLEEAFRFYAKTAKGMTDAQADDWSKRAATLVTKAERGWQEVVREVKDIIVVKTGTVLLGNIWSNAWLLMLQGVPIKDIVRNHQVALRAAMSYMSDTDRLAKLEITARTGATVSRSTQQEITRLKDAIARNPVKALIDEGMMPTIVEDVAAAEDVFSYKALLARTLEPYTSKAPKVLRDVGRQVYMTPDTGLYKILSRTTQLSDFVGRYTLYQHLTTRQDKPLSHKDAVQEASDAFVNYDIPMPKGLQYTDDMGITMFTKYFMRIQRVLLKTARENPARVLMTLALNQFMELGPIVLDSAAIAHVGDNFIHSGAIKYPSTLDELLTISAAMALVK